MRRLLGDTGDGPQLAARQVLIERRDRIQQRPRVRVTRIGEDIVDPALLDNVAAVQHQYALAHVGHHR